MRTVHPFWYRWLKIQGPPNVCKTCLLYKLISYAVYINIDNIFQALVVILEASTYKLHSYILHPRRVDNSGWFLGRGCEMETDISDRRNLKIVLGSRIIESYIQLIYILERIERHLNVERNIWLDTQPSLDMSIFPS